MSILLKLLGAILMFIGFIIGHNRGQNDREHPNGALEWIVFIIGVIVLGAGFWID